MAIPAETLKRIMGMPGSITGKLVATRRTPGEGELETGVWYSNFTRVKTEAEKGGIPFFAMWTNGDLCGFCKRFTENILDQSFLQFMRESGGLWWLGGSMDDDVEDKRGGLGFLWCLGSDHKVSYFPFVSVHHVLEDGTVRQFFGSGHDYDRGKKGPDGTAFTISKIRDVLTGVGYAVDVQATEEAKPVAINTSLHIRFNPTWDVAHIARFQAAMKTSGGHCLCQAQSPDTMCMCKPFLEQGVPGLCRCGAFEKYAV
jgi:hypothetical protein